MRWPVPLVLILGFLAGCSRSIQDPLYPTENPKPSAPDIVGTYVPTDETIQKIQQAGYPTKPVAIQIIDDTTFAVTNIPDFWRDIEGHSSGKFISDRGSWQCISDGSHWNLNLATTDPEGFTKSVALVGSSPPLTLRLIVTEPDTNLNLDFVKK